MNQNNNHFRFNSKYFTISCYVIGVIFLSIVAFRVINNLESTVNLIKKMFHVISPYFIGFLIAYLLNPLVNFLYCHLFSRFKKMKKKRTQMLLSVFSSYMIVLGVLIIVIAYIIPQLVSSISDLITKIPHFYNEITIFLNNFVSKYPDINTKTFNSIINDYLPHIQEFVMKQLQNIVPAVYGFSVSIIKFFINLMIAVIVSIYMISDKKTILRYLKKMIYATFNKSHADSFISVSKDCNEICKSFFIGKTIDSLIIGCLCFIIMSIFRLPYSMLVSVVVGITNMIPYFGPYIGAIPCIIILFIDHPMNGLIFAAIIIILQMFDGMILGPRILGTSTGLRPLAILFAITCGGAIAGPLGMFLGVPAFAIIFYLLDKLLNYRLKAKNIQIEDE